MTAVLRVAGLGKSFGGNRAVDGVGFEVAAGEMLAMIGPNGAGKSTTFNMVGGQLRADAGSVRLGGHELVGRSAREIWRLGVGRTFQIAETFASLTVALNVQLALLSAERKVFGMWRPAADHRRDAALALLESAGMREQADRPCSVLAYGDVKRVELALAMANAPRLLLMDEPTAGMAPAERNALMALTKRLAVERGTAVLFTEHSMDVVFAHADRVVVLSRGRLIAEGTPAQIRADPQVQQVYLGTGATFGKPAVVNAGAAGDGRARSAIRTPPIAARRGDDRSDDGLGGDALLRAESLDAWYGAAQMLDGVNLHVGRGEVVALTGRNGAGKSTTLKALMGLVAKRRGRIRFLGRDVSNAEPHDVARAGLGYVPEDRRVFGDLTVAQNLEVGRQPPRRGASGHSAPVWTPERLYALFPNLGDLRGRLAARMSGGEQQMLTVARTLMGNPHLVLLDEPSEGVAPIVVEQMARMIGALKAEGVGILLSEQNAHFAELVCDRAYLLEQGRIRFHGTMAELAADDAVRRLHKAV